MKFIPKNLAGLVLSSVVVTSAFAVKSFPAHEWDSKNKKDVITINAVARSVEIYVYNTTYYDGITNEGKPTGPITIAKCNGVEKVVVNPGSVAVCSLDAVYDPTTGASRFEPLTFSASGDQAAKGSFQVE